MLHSIVTTKCGYAMAAPKVTSIVLLWLLFLRQMSCQMSYESEKTYIVQQPQMWSGSINKPVSLQCEAFIPKSFLQMGMQTQEIKWMWRPPGSSEFADVQQSSNRNHRVTIYTNNYNDADSSKSTRLEFERVQASNAGEYKCVVGGGSTYGGAESEVALIRIIPEMMIYPSVINMEVNKPFSISCNLSVNPAQLYDSPELALNQMGQTVRPTLKWTVSTTLGVDPDDVNKMRVLYEDYARDPATLDKLNIIVSKDGQRLHVANATTDHAGYYWCTFQSYSKSFDGHIKQRSIVRYGPRFEEDQFKQYNTTRTLKSFIGSTVDIYCNIVSLPFGIVQWYRKGNIPLHHNQQRYPLLPAKSDRYYYFVLDKYRNPTILRLNRVIYDDRDEYTCNVTGGGVRLSWSTLLKVKDKYSAFYPLGVIVAQIGLIFALIFGAEKMYVQKHDHNHHHHHQPHSHQIQSQTHLANDSQMRRPMSAYGGGGGTLPRSQFGGDGMAQMNNPYAMDSSRLNVNNNNSIGGNTLSRIPNMAPISLLQMNDAQRGNGSPPITNLLFSSKGKI